MRVCYPGVFKGAEEGVGSGRGRSRRFDFGPLGNHPHGVDGDSAQSHGQQHARFRLFQQFDLLSVEDPGTLDCLDPVPYWDDPGQGIVHGGMGFQRSTPAQGTVETLGVPSRKLHTRRRSVDASLEVVV